MEAARARACVVAVAVAVVVERSRSDGRVPRSDGPRSTVEYHLHVDGADVPATSRHLRTYHTPRSSLMSIDQSINQFIYFRNDKLVSRTGRDNDSVQPLTEALKDSQH